MLPTSLETRVWGGDQCITMNSNSIVPPVTKQEKYSEDNLSLPGPQSSEHEQVIIFMGTVDYVTLCSIVIFISNISNVM